MNKFHGNQQLWFTLNLLLCIAIYVISTKLIHEMQEIQTCP